MDDLTFVRAMLTKYRYTQLDPIAKATNVSAGAIAKIKSGATVDPGFSTVRRLAEYFRVKSTEIAA